MLDLLAEYKEEMALVAAALGLFWSIAKFPGLLIKIKDRRRDANKAQADKLEEARKRKVEDADAVETIKKASIELTKRLDGTPGFWEVLEGSRPAEDVPLMKGLTKEWFSLYHSIYMRHQSGSLSEESWAGYADEMQKFVHFPYIRESLDFADAFSPTFGQYLRSLIQKET